MRGKEDIKKNRKNRKPREGELGDIGGGYNRRETKFDNCEEDNQYRNHN